MKNILFFLGLLCLIYGILITPLSKIPDTGRAKVLGRTALVWHTQVGGTFLRIEDFSGSRAIYLPGTIPPPLPGTFTLLVVKPSTHFKGGQLLEGEIVVSQHPPRLKLKKEVRMKEVLLYLKAGFESTRPAVIQFIMERGKDLWVEDLSTEETFNVVIRGEEEKVDTLLHQLLSEYDGIAVGDPDQSFHPTA